ncbi:MAG: SAM-dependent methyltransferase, partial [Lachnospiraceae bacterium]|nr:SAM-dependent methyltransferase [Lachnospiraceae bacterium]
SKGMVQWAKENAEASGLSDRPVRWLVDDCRKFVARELRRGNTYDAVIMDPPSYGRGPKGEIWKIEDAIHPLVKDCAKLLSDDPLFFLINSYTTGFAPSVLSYLLELEVRPEHGGTVVSDEIGLPVSDTCHVLPCGSSGRWMNHGGNT